MTKRKTKTARRTKRAGKSIVSAEYKAEHKPDRLAAAIRAAVESDGKVDLDGLAKLAAENNIEFRWATSTSGSSAWRSATGCAAWCGEARR